MPVFLVSFKHPKHNLKGQAQVVSTDKETAQKLFCAEFEKAVFHGFYENQPDLAKFYLRDFWSGVEFSCIDLDTEPVFGFSWERKDSLAKYIFRK